MNLSQLRAFVAVVEQKSFSAAARTLDVSQPAVTLQIQALEHQLGATLLERRYKRVSMTEAGLLVYPVALSILERWGELSEALAELHGTVGGRLVIAGSTTPAHYLLPRLVGDFKREHPDTTVLLEVADSQATVDRLLSGAADTAFVGEVPRERRVQCEEFATDAIVVVAPAGHALAGRKRKAPAEVLTREPLVFREKGSATRHVVEQHLTSLGLAPADLDVTLELGTSEAVVGAVESGLGIGIVSRFAAEKALALGTVAELKVETFPIRRLIYVCTVTKRPLTRAAEAFLDFARARRPT